MAHQPSSGKKAAEGQFVGVECRYFEIFGDLAVVRLKDQSELKPLPRIRPVKSWQFNRGQEAPGQLLVRIDDARQDGSPATTSVEHVSSIRNLIQSTTLNLICRLP